MIGYVQTPINEKVMLPEDVVQLINEFEKENILTINDVDKLINKIWYIFSDGVIDFSLSEEEQQKKITEWRNNDV